MLVRLTPWKTTKTRNKRQRSGSSNDAIVGISPIPFPKHRKKSRSTTKPTNQVEQERITLTFSKDLSTFENDNLTIRSPGNEELSTTMHAIYDPIHDKYYAFQKNHTALMEWDAKKDSDPTNIFELPKPASSLCFYHERKGGYVVGSFDDGSIYVLKRIQNVWKVIYSSSPTQQTNGEGNKGIVIYACLYSTNKTKTTTNSKKRALDEEEDEKQVSVIVIMYQKKELIMMHHPLPPALFSSNSNTEESLPSKSIRIPIQDLSPNFSPTDIHITNFDEDTLAIVYKNHENAIQCLPFSVGGKKRSALVFAKSEDDRTCVQNIGAVSSHLLAKLTPTDLILYDVRFGGSIPVMVYRIPIETIVPKEYSNLRIKTDYHNSRIVVWASKDEDIIVSTCQVLIDNAKGLNHVLESYINTSPQNKTMNLPEERDLSKILFEEHDQKPNDDQKQNSDQETVKKALDCLIKPQYTKSYFTLKVNDDFSLQSRYRDALYYFGVRQIDYNDTTALTAASKDRKLLTPYLVCRMFDILWNWNEYKQGQEDDDNTIKYLLDLIGTGYIPFRSYGTFLLEHLVELQSQQLPHEKQAITRLHLVDAMLQCCDLNERALVQLLNFVLLKLEIRDVMFYYKDCVPPSLQTFMDILSKEEENKEVAMRCLSQVVKLWIYRIVSHSKVNESILRSMLRETPSDAVCQTLLLLLSSLLETKREKQMVVWLSALIDAKFMNSNIVVEEVEDIQSRLNRLVTEMKKEMEYGCVIESFARKCARLEALEDDFEEIPEYGIELLTI